MVVKAVTVVGLDVHARQTHAAILDLVSGELRVSRLRMAPVEVAGFLEGLGPAVRAVYEAGRPGSVRRASAAPSPEVAPAGFSLQSIDSASGSL